MKCYTGERFSSLFLLFYVFCCFCVTSQFYVILIPSSMLLFGRFLCGFTEGSFKDSLLDARWPFLRRWKSINFLCGKKDDERFYRNNSARSKTSENLSMQQIDSRKNKFLRKEVLRIYILLLLFVVKLILNTETEKWITRLCFVYIWFP